MANMIVRNNLMTQKGYSPYCGDEFCKPRTPFSPERWPRTRFNGKQFECPKCGWKSGFPHDFIQKYEDHWGK